MLEMLVFIDETSLKTNLVNATGWAPVGARLIDHAPFGHWNTQTFIAGLGHNGLPLPSRSPRRGLSAISIIRMYSPWSSSPRTSPREIDHSPWPPMPAFSGMACDISRLTRSLPSGKGWM